MDIEHNFSFILNTEGVTINSPFALQVSAGLLLQASTRVPLILSTQLTHPNAIKVLKRANQTKS